MATNSNLSVFALFSDLRSQEQAVSALAAEGFRAEDIAVLVANNAGNMDFGLMRRTKAPEGIVAGATLLGATATMISQWLELPVLRLSTIAPHYTTAPRPLLALAGLGLGGLIGGLCGGLWGFGVPKYVARRWAGRKRQLGVLVSIHCDDKSWAQRASTLCEQHGAVDLSLASEGRADFQSSERPYATPMADRY